MRADSRWPISGSFSVLVVGKKWPQHQAKIFIGSKKPHPQPVQRANAYTWARGGNGALSIGLGPMTCRTRKWNSSHLWVRTPSEKVAGGRRKFA